MPSKDELRGLVEPLGLPILQLHTTTPRNGTCSARVQTPLSNSSIARCSDDPGPGRITTVELPLSRDCSNRKRAPKIPILCAPIQKEHASVFYDAVQLTRPTNDTQKTSSGHGSMMAQSSGPFFTVFMSAVRPPWRSIHFFTVSG